MSELGSGLPAFSANAIDGSTVALSLLSALVPAISAAMVSSFVRLMMFSLNMVVYSRVTPVH